MQVLYAAILGLVQGFTEFLPISSSGHLALIEKYLVIDQPGLIFDTILHIGTTLAVVWYFRERILNITKHEVILLIIGTIPAGIIGLLFSDQLEHLFFGIKLLGIQFLITALLNFYTDKNSGSREKMDWWDAIFIGIFQAIAIIPGISRSGATLFAGTKMKLSKKTVAEYSFLLSIPAIVGANAVEFLKYSGDTNFSISLALVGLVTAFISGLLSIGFLMRLLTENHLKYFSYYLIVLGTIIILFL